jgi:tRNA 2-selenouridine synthase
MPQLLEPEAFLSLASSRPVIDVRSPVEFDRGHIPGALNLYLFSDEERAAIGTLYHQQSREAAFSKGLEMVSPRLGRLVDRATEICPDKKVLLYCLRGGMRSNSMSFLLETAGFEVSLLNGGYKSYRTYALKELEAPLSLIVLGGMTGSGKTELLESLAGKGMQVVDLEGLAKHKGSVFGGIGQGEQPSSEHFENLLFSEFRKLDKAKPLVLEDENMDIGKVKLPLSIYRKIRTAPIIVMQVPRDIRVKRLSAEYDRNRDELIHAIQRIERRLGNQRMKLAVEAVQQNRLSDAAEILLEYYDESYMASIRKRSADEVHFLDAINGVQENVAEDFAVLANNFVKTI